MDARKVMHAVSLVRDYKDNGDDEYAYMAERDAWGEALLLISEGAPNPRELAQKALKTLDIEFSRWYRKESNNE